MTAPRIAARPPEYWPRLHFLALLDAVDRFVLADTFQYSRQSFQNRVPVRTPDGSAWLSIPLAGGQHGKPIDDVAVHGPHRWIRKHRRALHFNYRTTPFFDFYEPRLRALFEGEWDRLGDLTCTSVCLLASLYGIDTPVDRSSELLGSPSSIAAITAGVGGGEYFSAEDTLEVDRRLTDVQGVLRLEPFEYRQNFEGFEPGMSGLDLLFNYGPEALPMLRRAAGVRRVSIPQNEPYESGLG